MKKYFLVQVLFLASVLSQIDAGSWSSPVTLEGTWSINPSLAADSKGNAVAVWIHFDEDLFWIHAATKKAGYSWSSPVTLSGPFQRTDVPREQPVVLFDQKDNAFAIWQAKVGERQIIQGAFLPKGKQAWTFVQTPFSTEHTYDDSVHVAFDSPGSALIVCKVEKKNTISSVIESARVQLNTMSWTPLARITLPYNAYKLSMALDGSGNARLLWSELHLPQGGCPLAVHTCSLAKKASKWSEPKIIHTSSCVFISPLAVDRAGNALCLWNERNEKRTEWSMGSALLLSGTDKWKRIPFPEIAIPDDNRRADPMLASDPEGNVLAVWLFDNVNSASHVLKSSRFSMKEMSWSAPIEVVRSTTIPYFTELSFDPFGNALFLWMSNEKWMADDESQYALHATTLPKGKLSVWTAPEVILADTQLNKTPNVAFSKDNRCHAIYWKQHADVPSYAVQSIEGTNLFLKKRK